ncbi:MAG: 16S rRNA (cytosine(967)-C(5))-methyltransferase RsmB [Bacteroidetes bacterium]|nr:16S rRNA (cytosine(967)-C(5))-methyltransferase RsmB [Bacteroidota bacterium]
MKKVIQADFETSTDRSDAIQQLLRITYDGAYRSLVDRSASPRVVALVSTVTRWRRYLRFLLRSFLRNKLRPIPQALEQLLLLGIAEIVLLNAPPHAVVNEIVNLARSMRFSTTLTNGVLRSVVRAHARLPEPETGDSVRDLAIRWSHPTWLVRRYVKRFSVEEAAVLLQRNNDPPAYTVRINQIFMETVQFIEELEDHGFQANQSGLLEEYVHLKSLGPLIREGFIDRGLCSVHDESSGLVVALLDPQPGETILDACAAPGGKALAIACRMGGSGQLHAWDIHPNRLRKVEEMAKKQGLENVHTRAVNFLKSSEIQSDRVLLDVPCSGTGVLNKRADLRWRRRETDLIELAKLQHDLLDAAVTHVRPGGQLVYSTCSIEPEENEMQVDSFLRRHSNFVIEHAGDFLPAATVTQGGYLATLPHRHQMDGAFAARLRRCM